MARVGDAPEWADPELDDSSWSWVALPSSHYLKAHRKELFPWREGLSNDLHLVPPRIRRGRAPGRPGMFQRAKS
jgi:hypothetical protein